MRRRLAIAVAVAAALAALIPVGRWEARRHAAEEVAGIRVVLAAIGPVDQPSLSGYRVGIGLDYDFQCLLYRRGANPFALEFCFDPAGRVVEAYDRRGAEPRIWSIREDPEASDVVLDVRQLQALVDRLRQPAE